MELNGTTYHKDTPKEVAEVLENARQEKIRIRVWYGENGASWDEENDIIGYVGRSTGTVKIPLLINNARSMGGGGLLCSIVKIVDVKSKRVLYQHPKFKQSHFRADDTLVWKGLPGTNEEIYANCKTWQQAQRLTDFMNGKRMSR